MNQFSSIRKLDQAILYLLELASSLSILLLAFGLIASMANVLTKGSVLSDNLIMQRIWAWTQCIAIDASIAGTSGWSLQMALSITLIFSAAYTTNNIGIHPVFGTFLTGICYHVTWRSPRKFGS